MADAYTNQAATDFAQLIWSKSLYWPLRDELVFDAVAEKKSTTEGGTRGKSVSFLFPNDLAVATATLDEVITPDSVAMSDTTVNIPLEEKGNVVKTTALARATGAIDVDMAAVNVIAFNAGSSLDTLAATALAASTNVQYQESLANNAALTTSKTMTTKTLEQAAATFRVRNVPRINGTYWMFMHPYQVLDLRVESGAGGFRYARENSGAGIGELKNGNIEGEWAGWTIVSSNREPFTADVGTPGTVDAYSALAVGAQGLAKAYSDAPGFGEDPNVIFGLPVDAMKRTHPISWYWLGKYKILRSAAVLKVNTAASLGAN
jgi:N4-gp56 family major capsid protein